MQGSKGNTDVKNRLVDSVGESEVGMIGENSIETYTLPYVEQMTSVSSMDEAGHSKSVPWDSPEGQDGEGGRQRASGRWYTCIPMSILNEINPEYSLEGMMWKLKLQHFDT